MRADRLACLVAIFAALAVAGCTTTRVPASLPLPDPDPRLVDPNWCGRGDARAGDDAVVAGRRKENARGCEAGRVAAWGRFYGQLQAARPE